ncbi:MAG: ATP-binding protein [Chlamydiales bacterium]
MQKELIAAAKQNPVVTITGPRQSGKTTLVKEAFPDKPYANLESLRTRELAETDPVGFIDRFPEGAVLDEIQRCPELLSEIQVRVDESNKNGMFILTGSHQAGLHEAIAQSLAGRTAILHLLPLSIEELREAGFTFTLDDLLYQGCFPRIYKNKMDPTKTYGSYVQTYLEKDLRQMIEVKNLHLFQKFIKLCAGRIGQIFNRESLSKEVGVSAKTISEWLSILEASYLIFLLPPYFENFGKRTIKSPKLYFCDVGLAAYLLGIESTTQMDRDPLRGNLVENLIILELIKSRWNQGHEHHLYFYRDSQKNEVDLLFQRGRDLIPIEIKSAKTFHKSFLDGLTKFKALVGDRYQSPTLIYSGKEEQTVKGIQLLHFSNCTKALKKEQND